MNLKTRIKLFFKQFKWAYQRATRGYADIDVWSIRDWFLFNIKPMLKQFKNGLHSKPGWIGWKEYHEKLDEMLACLDMMEEDSVIELLKGNIMPDIEKAKLMVENKNRFFELFSELFYDLWD